MAIDEIEESNGDRKEDPFRRAGCPDRICARCLVPVWTKRLSATPIPTVRCCRAAALPTLEPDYLPL